MRLVRVVMANFGVYSNIEMRRSSIEPNIHIDKNTSLYAAYSEFWLKMLSADDYFTRSKLLAEFQSVVNSVCKEQDDMKLRIASLEYTITGTMLE